MLKVTAEMVSDSLRQIGIHRGDGLLVHAAVQYLGQPVQATPGLAGGMGMYLEAIQQAIGDDGTIAVPTFNFSFAQGLTYDPQATPSQGMGAFSELVRQHPQASRTSHPMQSLAVLGRYAADLASRDTPSAFDPGSAFERMLELDFKLLLLGADVSAVSIFHYSEIRYNVPYRYWKDFRGQVRTSHGWQERTYRMFVRDLELNPQLTADPVQELLEQRGQWRTVELNYGHIAACRLRDFVAGVDHFLALDPWSLVTNRPQ
jgi:aminoglycoside 3-N-acetyltransferase